MKFLSINENENIQTDILKADYEQSHEIGKVHLGNNILFVKKRLKVYYISYSEIYRAFRRVKAVPARICCGRGEIRLEYIVLCDNKNELCEIDLPEERAAVAIIEELSKKASYIKIGKKD